jgi:hypothetical protein
MLLEYWAIVDFVGKGNHVRTVPMPVWVKKCSRQVADHGARLFRSHRADVLTTALRIAPIRGGLEGR